MSKKDPLDKIFVDFYLYCEVCKKKLGFYKKAGGYGYQMEQGTIMTGQGIGKPQLCFCNKECYEIWEKKHDT